MTTSVNLFDRTTTVNPATLAKIAFLGVAVGATANSVYDVDNPDTVASTVGGYGNLVEGAAAAIRESSRPQVAVVVNPSVAAVLGSLTQSGSGPVIVASGTPRDNFPLRLKMKLGGALGTSRFVWALDGGNYQGEDYTPEESSATVTGTVDISTGADLEGFTLIFTLPAAETLTFAAGSLTASTAGLKAATATVAAPVTLTASDLLTAGKTAILAHPRRLVFTTAGVTPADAPASVDIVGTYKGAVVSETLNLAQTATSATSVNDYDAITSLDYPAADGTAATIAIGYSSAFEDGDEVVTAFNALAVAAPLNVRARLVQGKYLQTYSTATGSSATQTISASSTADTKLGLSNSPATGDPATFSPPNSGITFTFPTGTYVVDEVYSWECTGPRFDSSDITDAMDALLADTTKTWDDIVILGVPADGTETKAWADAIKAKLATWRGTDPKRATFVFFPSSLGATGTSGITTNDSDVKTQMLSFTDQYQCCVHGDGYGQGTEFPGKLRRPLVHAVGVLAASRRFSADLGSRDYPEIPEWDMTAPDGTTKARDENTAVVKMYSRQSSGQRFTVCKQEKSLPYIVKSVSRAATTSKFRHVGVIRMGRAALNLGYDEARKLENTDPALTGAGKLRPPQAKSKATAIQRRFEAELRDPGHCSEVRIQLDIDEQVSTTDNITINGEILPNGQAESVTFNIGVVSELTLP